LLCSLKPQAGLGQKDLPIQEAQHAIDLMPIWKEIYDGALVLEALAQAYAWSGDGARGIEPAPRRPRFEKMVTALISK